MNYPRIVFFDAVGTLFDIRGSVGEIYGEFAQKAGVSVDYQQLNAAFMQNFRAAPRAAFAGADPQQFTQLEYEWWQAIAYQSFAQVGADALLTNFDTFFQPLFDHFAIADPWVLYPETPQVLAEIQSLGIELAMISNFDSRLHNVLEALDLAQWFSSVTISTQVGAAKPAREIFEAALASYSYRPDEAWHVGDSWPEDYEGATTAGFQGVWLNRDRRQERPKAATPKAGNESDKSNKTTKTQPIEIQTLSALPSILKA